MDKPPEEWTVPTWPKETDMSEQAETQASGWNSEALQYMVAAAFFVGGLSAYFAAGDYQLGIILLLAAIAAKP